MMLRRQPISVLRPFVKALWVSHSPGRVAGNSHDRERVLPTGDMHLVFRCAGQPLRILDAPDDRHGRTLRYSHHVPLTTATSEFRETLVNLLSSFRRKPEPSDFV